AALQLRLLQTVVAVAAEKNSTLVLPFPVELLRFLERAAPAAPAPPVTPVAPGAPQPVQEQLPSAEPQSDPESKASNSGQD
ncbi:slipin family protein, partial [Streptomyces sp. NPDC005538]